MKEYKDQMHHVIRLEEKSRRIISLVPSQTELLYDLGLREEVVGITKFCIHPGKWFRTKNRVGGTKNVSIGKVKALQPDLIIGNKEENEKENILDLQKVAPVWMSDIENLQQAIEMILSIGELVDRKNEAKQLVDSIHKEFDQLEIFLKKQPIKRKKVVYLIWKDPYIVAGKNTFIDSMLTILGFENYTNEARYPEFKANGPIDYIFLSSEPFPFTEKHIQEISNHFPTSTVILVDGEMFSWYGSRLKLAPKYFKELMRFI